MKCPASTPVSTLEYLDEAAERAQQRRLADAARAGDEQILRRLQRVL